MEFNSDFFNSDLWGKRRRLNVILARFDLDIFEWLCLDACRCWYQWDYPLGQYLHKCVVIEKYWDSGAYLPDISVSAMIEADAAIRAAGLVSKVDIEMAEAMIREQSEYDCAIYRAEGYDSSTYLANDLVGLRVLSASGLAAWQGVRGLQGYWKGFRFLKFVSVDMSTDGRKVFHSPRKFRPELVCEACAEAQRDHGGECFAKVGPWFRPETHVWPWGWRLICPHDI